MNGLLGNFLRANTGLRRGVALGHTILSPETTSRSIGNLVECGLGILEGELALLWTWTVHDWVDHQ